MSKASAQPKALIHRIILDEAEGKPDASINELANSVSAATPDLVERVLDEYGDPGEKPTGQQSFNKQADDTLSDQQSETEQHVTSTDEALLSINDVTKTQRKILKAIAKNPTATQGELGDQFDVASATICSHVNSIDGFNWDDRKDFVEGFLPSVELNAPGSSSETEAEEPADEREAEEPADEREAEEPAVVVNDAGPTIEAKADGGTGSDLSENTMIEEEQSQATGTDESQCSVEGEDGSTELTRQLELQAELQSLREHLIQVEEQVKAVDADSNIVFDQPELAHKVIHACMKSDVISEDEEVQIIKQFL
jgi:hypothetical protein